MEMLQCRFILASLLVLNGCFFEVSCQTIYIRSYTTKDAETLPCTISDETSAVSWNDVDNSIAVLTYQKGNPPVIIISTEAKYTNFNYTLTPTSLNLVIENVEDGDGGVYSCTVFGANPVVFDVSVEVIPDEISLDCFVPPAVTCPAQGVTPASELICTCAATGVRPKSLSLDISGADNVQQDSPVAKDGLFDLSLKATVPVTDSTTEVTCSVNGYNTTEPIPPNLITKALVISPPACALEISFDQDCKEVTLSCSCSAIPTDGETPSESGMVFSYFNGTGHLIAGDATSIVQSNDVEAGVDLTYSCRGCNGLYYGDSSYDTESKVCTISTTALPTTTIVTTAPPSTNEPTSTKAMVTTTEEPKDDNPKNPGRGLTTGAKIGISLGAVAVVVVIVVVAVILWKNGKCGSNSSSSSVTDVKVTATNSHTTNSEPAPAPVYGEIKKDRKKKSDKLDDNGAGPRGDPEIPAYGVVDKNRTKDPTPAPRSSMRDSKNPSNPKQDGPLELQYAALDHGNKPPSDEVRKPKEEPTEYATVQSVIV